MKITIEKSNLLKAIGVAIRAVPSKSSLPILENFLFTMEEDTLKVTATDTNLTIITTTEAEGEGASCIPAKTLTDIVKTLPDGSIEIETEETTCEVRWASGHSTIPCFDVKDFPEVGNIPEKEFAKVKGEELLNALRHTLPCIGNDPIRPVLSGIFFHRIGDTINLVSSDTHVMSVCPINVEGGIEESFIVPGNVAAFVKDNVTDEVSIVSEDTAIFFELGETYVQARKIEGKFPNYANVIPKKSENILTCETAKLSQVVKRVSICSNKSTNHIKLSLAEMAPAVLEAKDLGFGTSATEHLDFVHYEGEEMAIGFKADYLTKIIDSQTGEKIEASFTDPRHAVLITSTGDNSKAIVMPVAIQ